MKKNRILSIGLLSVALMGTLPSCDAYLDREPQSEYLSGNFYSSAAAIKLGANGCYQKIYLDVSGASLPYLELLDHYHGLGHERGENSTVGSGHAFATAFGWEALWAYSYEGIARCNTVLDGAAPFMDKLSSDAKAMQYLSEIKVLRGYFYYMLVNLFGDVPYMSTANLPKDQWMNVTREKAAVVIANVTEDLEEAAKYLPWKYQAAEDFGRCDRSFAYGIIARMALNAGSINLDGNGQSYFKTAAEASKKIMDESGRDLASNYEDLFHEAGQIKEEVRNEIIFALQYGGDVTSTAYKAHYLSYGCGSRNVSQSGRFPTQMLVDTYETSNGKRIDEEGSNYNPRDPHANRDPRLKYNIYTHGDEMIGNNGARVKFKVELFNDKTSFWNYDNNEWETRTNRDRDGGLEMYAFALNGVGYMWKKHNFHDNQPWHLATNDFVVMRMAEIYLTYAEAKIELNEIDGTVYNAINKVRFREGVNMPDITVVDPTRMGDQAKMRQIVRRERKVEMPREGLHFFDARRWRTAELENQYSDGTSRPNYGFPFASPTDSDAEIASAKTNLGKNKNPYSRLPLDMIPSFGAPGSAEDINDIPDYRYATNPKYNQVLRVRDVNRYWEEAFYLCPIPRAERNKAPQITNNPGYRD